MRKDIRKRIALLCAGIFLMAQTAFAQVDMTTPQVFDSLGVSQPGEEGTDTPAAADPAAPDPAAPDPVTPDPVAPDPVTPDPGAPDPVTPGPITPPPPPPGDDPVTPPPPPPADPVLEVFLAAGGATTGPFNRDQLLAKVRSGELTPDTYVWMEGMTEWKRAKDVPELQKILASAPPPAPDTPSFDALSYLVGSWESDPQPMNVPGVDRATIRGTIAYRRDKTFEGFGSITMTAQGLTNTLNFTLTGTFELQNISEKGFVISQKGSATYHMPLGPVTESASGAFNVQIVDQNTMLNADGGRSRRVR